MLQKSCATCNAWFRQHSDQGLCRAKPPTPILMGYGEQAISLQAAPQQVPIMNSHFPTMMAHGWCREHQEIAT